MRTAIPSITIGLTLTFLLVFGANSVSAQIFHALSLNDTLDIKGRRAIEIREELKIGNATIKYLQKINDNHQVISDERHDNSGNFIARFTYTYDSSNNLKTSAKKELVDKSGNHYFNTEKYEYSKEGLLIKIIYLSDNGEVSNVVLVTNNDKGQPYRMEEFTPEGVLTGSEIAEYKYKENKVTYDRLDANGTITYSGFFILDYDREKNMSRLGFEYDVNGNLLRFPDGFNVITYDHYGNWTSIKTYKEINGSKKLTQEHTRTIKYFE